MARLLAVNVGLPRDEHARVGDTLDVSSPRGSFILEPGERPVVLISAGIGASPVLAMLHALAAARTERQVFWLHGARDRQHHAFAAEARRLIATLTHGRSYVCYSGGITAHWKASAYQSILELAEACDLSVRWSCRSGVCHSCESGLVSGQVAYGPEPLDAPAAGNVLICCARPTGDVVIDL